MHVNMDIGLTKTHGVAHWQVLRVVSEYFLLNRFKYQVALEIKYIFVTLQMTQSNVKMSIVL